MFLPLLCKCGNILQVSWSRYLGMLRQHTLLRVCVDMYAVPSGLGFLLHLKCSIQMRQKEFLFKHEKETEKAQQE